MEGSTNNTNVANYEILAKYYDELLSNEEDLSLWIDYVKQKDCKDILELASGSGLLAKRLKQEGYSVIASDISKDMQEIAKNNFDGEYLLLNMTDYSLDRKFDLIICICDSFNYLYEEEIESFIKCAYNHLNDNGRLIFDMHSIKRLTEFKQEFIEEGYLNDVAYYWTINSDEIDNTINQHFTFYTKDGMIQEHHTQYVYDTNLINEYMSKYFKTVIIEDFIEDEKVLVIGEKI